MGLRKEKVKPRNVIIIASFIQKEKERERKKGKHSINMGENVSLSTVKNKKEKNTHKNSLARAQGGSKSAGTHSAALLPQPPHCTVASSSFVHAGARFPCRGLRLKE